jgi:hypothetical protein
MLNSMYSLENKNFAYICTAIFAEYSFKYAILFELCLIFLAITFNQPKLSSCSMWNSSAKTIQYSRAVDAEPSALFVDTNDTIYASLPNLDQIRIWSNEDSSSGISLSSGLIKPSSIFVTNYGEIYIDNSVTNRRIDKYTSHRTSINAWMYLNSTCHTIFIDLNFDFYCSMTEEHQVIKKSLYLNADVIGIAAGSGTSGSDAFMLNTPRGIFVNSNFDLYVADCNNHRVQLFRSGQRIGITIVGNVTIEGKSLNCPSSVIVDGDGNVFISDSNNDRIIRLTKYGSECLFGCTNTNTDGLASEQLTNPQGISFDSKGNILVADYGNRRIQKFILLNNSCGK